MPAPYPLLDLPPGDFSNPFDYQAINMAAAHNMFIQGFNSVVYHAPSVTGDKVEPFMIFCITLLDILHHHHTLEETYYFPIMEEKLGKGALEVNVEQHKDFIPGIETLHEWCEKVQKGEVVYDAKVLLGLIESFSDTMVAHLKAEIPTLDTNLIQKHFTADELKAIDKEFVKRALAAVDFYKELPMTLVCANPKTLWFPPIPTPIKWAARWWFSRRYSEAWKFGALDVYGNERPKA